VNTHTQKTAEAMKNPNHDHEYLEGPFPALEPAGDLVVDYAVAQAEFLDETGPFGCGDQMGGFLYCRMKRPTAPGISKWLTVPLRKTNRTLSILSFRIPGTSSTSRGCR
jgi:hypothetical protein